MKETKATFAEGMARLAAVFAFLEKQTIADPAAAEAVSDFLAEEERDRAEIECERCGYWPCVCGDPEFESFVSQELDRAAEVDSK